MFISRAVGAPTPGLVRVSSHPTLARIPASSSDTFGPELSIKISKKTSETPDQA
jgi:hypothetical protein